MDNNDSREEPRPLEDANADSGGEAVRAVAGAAVAAAPTDAVARASVSDDSRNASLVDRYVVIDRSPRSSQSVASASHETIASGPSNFSHQAMLRQQAHAFAPTRPTVASAGRSLSSPTQGTGNGRNSGAASSNSFARSSASSNYYQMRLDDRSAVSAGGGGAQADRSSNLSILAAPEQEVAEDPVSPAASNGWTEVQTGGGTPPSARSLHAAALLNGIMYVFGGYDGIRRVNTFHAFSFAEKRWSPVLPSANSANPPSPRDRHVAVAYGNSFYVHGGFDGTSRVSDFWGFDFSSMTWREVAVLQGRPPSARHSHAAVVHRQSLFIFGGYDGSYKSDLHEFDFSQSQWNVVQPNGRRPRARYRATAVVHKNTMILYGGHDGTRHLSDTHIFDFDTRTWSALVTEGTPPIPRDSHVSVIYANSMYIFGGSSGSAMNDLHELQLPSTATSSPAKWRPVKTSGTGQPSHRFCHVGVAFNEAMFVFGGYDGSERLNDFIRFDFAVYDLSFEVPASTILSEFRAMVDDDTMSDVTFIVEGTPVYAHKLMLMRCTYFRALFLGDMKESRLSSIQIEQVSHSIFLQVLEYLYTDHLRIPFESAMELFEAADLFCIPRLKTMCEKRILQSIIVDNAASIFYAADMHSAVALRQKAKKYILSHFEAVSKTTGFEDMGRSNIELVFELLQSR